MAWWRWESRWWRHSLSVFGVRFHDVWTLRPATILSAHRDDQTTDRSAWAGLRGGMGIVRCRGAASAGADLRKSGRGEEGGIWGYYNNIVGLGLTETPHFCHFNAVFTCWGCRWFARGFYCIERAAVDKYLVWVLVGSRLVRSTLPSFNFVLPEGRDQVQIMGQIFGAKYLALKTFHFRLLSSFYGECL